MARAKDPAVRTLLLERAAVMLRSREPVTLRSLVAGTGVSTMAVYTHFGGMQGLWRALRQEGFTRLAARMDAVRVTDDPVADLAALLTAYVANAVDHPDLYRVMFDDAVDLEDLAAADATLELLVQALVQARATGLVSADADPLDLAVRAWAVTHGLTSLVVNGPLPLSTLDGLVPTVAGLLGAAGGDLERCLASISAGTTRSPDPLPSEPRSR